jgi:hypothetical protein
MSIENTKNTTPAYSYEAYRNLEERNAEEAYAEQLDGEFIETRIAHLALSGHEGEFKKLIEDSKSYKELSDVLISGREEFIGMLELLEKVPGDKARKYAAFLAKFIEDNI